MKLSENHSHTKNKSYKELTEEYEGLRLLIDGKLKHIPNITIRQPKTNKQKEALKEKAR